MRSLWAFLVILLSIGTAQAADNAIVLTPGVGVTERSVDIGGGVQAPGVVPVGSNGVGAWGMAGTANANVLTVQGVASMTALQIAQATAASLNATVVGTGTFAAQVNGFTSWGGATLGAASAWGVAPTGNVAGVNANLVACAAGICNANGQATMANSAPVALASNQSVADPCTYKLKQSAPINLTASGKIITGTTALKTYICAYHLVTATAQNIALVEGTGTVCATNIFGLAGGTTAATGWNFAANSGLARGDGHATLLWGSGDANVTAADVCLLLSSSGQTSGNISYVQQ